MTISVYIIYFLLILGSLDVIVPDHSLELQYMQRKKSRMSAVQGLIQQEYRDPVPFVVTPIHKLSNKPRIVYQRSTTPDSDESDPVATPQILRATTDAAFRELEKESFKLDAPRDIFYRRQYEIYQDKLQKAGPVGLLCQPLVRAYLSGARDEESLLETLEPSDLRLHKIFQLLAVNTTGYSQAELYSIIQKVYEQKFRIFQWSPRSILLLLRVLNPANKFPTLGSLRQSLKALMKKWLMDIQDVDILIRNSKIYRPPCVSSGAKVIGVTQPLHGPTARPFYQTERSTKTCPDQANTTVTTWTPDCEDTTVNKTKN